VCGTCGCSEQESRTVRLEVDVLAKNDHLAARNRDRLRERGVHCVNVMSSPGSGKTTLLERTIRELGDRLVGVVEGDQETSLDAERIRATGAPVVQVNTGSGCHLDARMLHDALDELQPPTGSVLLVENVGNLVCPALFDLGEEHRAVVMSAPEGADKPLKYPLMFAGADVVLLNKIDLLPYLDFDMARFLADLSTVSPAAHVLQVSARTGEGLEDWCSWLREHAPARVGAPAT
jgi:hydrogenase nickel incorporation protein HypB